MYVLCDLDIMFIYSIIILKYCVYKYISVQCNTGIVYLNYPNSKLIFTFLYQTTVSLRRKDEFRHAHGLEGAWGHRSHHIMSHLLQQIK